MENSYAMSMLTWWPCTRDRAASTSLGVAGWPEMRTEISWNISSKLADWSVHHQL